MARIPIAWIVLASCVSGVHAQVSVDLAEYRPDTTTDDTWSEGAVEIRTFFGEDYTPAGGIHVFLRNASDEAVPVDRPALDGTPLDDLTPEDVVWWRCFPNPIPPRGHAELYVRLRKSLDAPARVSAWAGAVQLAATVEPSDGPDMDCVAYSPEMRRVYVYVRRPAGSDVRVERVLWDGREAGSEVYAPGFFHDVAPIVVTTGEPLTYGSVHYVRVDLSDSSWCGALLRAWDSFYSIGIFGGPYPELYAEAGFNTYNSFGPIDREGLDRFAAAPIKTIAQGYVGKAGGVDMTVQEIGATVGPVAGHPALLAYYLMDEPDVVDYREEDFPAPLRVGANAANMEWRRQFAWELDPSRLSFLLVDNTYKPANWQIYGQLADIFDTDPYYYLDDNQYVRKVTRIARYASRPKPLHITTYISRWGAHNRFPTPSEARRNDYYALGEGARDINHYIYSGAGPEGGASENPVLWREMSRITAEIKQVAPLLARATPVACVTSSHPKAYARALLCADQGLAIVVVNEASEGDGRSFQEYPLRDVELRVHLPSWLDFRTPRVISPLGEEEVPWCVEDDTATIQLPVLDSGLFVLLPATPTDRPAPTVLLHDPEEAGQQEDARFVHSGTAFPHIEAIKDESLGDPLGLERNAWQWQPEGVGERVQLSWAFDVPSEAMPSGRWTIRQAVYSMPWVAYPPPDMELSIRTEGGLVLARRSLELAGGLERLAVLAEFSMPGRYVAVLAFRSRGTTRVAIGRALYVGPAE